MNEWPLNILFFHFRLINSGFFLLKSVNDVNKIFGFQRSAAN
jgi:hypothetical protein